MRGGVCTRAGMCMCVLSVFVYISNMMHGLRDYGSIYIDSTEPWYITVMN